MNKMPRILLHPGFHKTGTSSIQHFLWVNREKLEPHVQLLMLRHLKPVTSLVHNFSRTSNPLVLLDLSERLDTLLSQLPFDGRDILVSCEALCGHLPGWPNVDTYSAAPVTVSYVANYLAEHFGAIETKVVLTTRERSSWLFSAYRHHLKGHRLRMDFGEFAATYSPAADFAPIVDALRSELGDVVTTLPLEDTKAHALGPGGALLDAFGIDPTGFTPVGKGNTGPNEALWREFLTINRSGLSDEEVIAAKDALADETQLGGWRTA